MFIVEGPAMALPRSLCFLMLPSFSGTPLFLRTFFLSGPISPLVMMHVPGTIRSVRVHGAMCFEGLSGCVGLIDHSCCSQDDISSRDMDSGFLNCAGKDVSFMALQTVLMGDACFCVITCICVCSCLIHHKENTISHSPLRHMIYQSCQ